MNIALEGINPPLRIVPDKPAPLLAFWEFAAENRVFVANDCQTERLLKAPS
jgi:hypothetical protein